MPAAIPTHASSSGSHGSSPLVSISVVALLALLAMLLFASVRQESGLGDETMHLFGGYEYWKHADFGRNPEHPPFAKMLAALPLLRMHLREPPPVPIPFFKSQDGANSTEFLYTQNADEMLMRGRSVVLLFSLCLGSLLFFAGREMFGPYAGLLALGLFVFEPVVLAHGALITTDIPLTCLFFATVYAFYRYLQTRTWLPLALTAVACGLTISTKHSGILILPTLFLLTLFDIMLTRHAFTGVPGEPSPTSRRAHRLAGALTFIVLFSYVALWAIYGFRFAARPGELKMTPSLALYSAGLTPFKHGLISFFAQHHLFPEAYLYGWVDILLIAPRAGSFFLGRFYTHGQWSYLPAIFLVKTTVSLMLLLLVVPFTSLFSQSRKALFLVLPPALYALFSISSTINLGIRHLLPIYPFCFILAASAAVFFIQRYRFAWIGVSALLLLSLVSSLHAFPDYLVYANEIFGGPSQIYRLAVDSNADWGQGLKWTRQYLDRNPTSQCWVAHESAPVVSPDYYGVHCKPLLSGFSRMIGTPVPLLPRTISGTIFIGTTDITGYHWGPGALNPYAAFRDRRPDAILNNDIRVYQGTYDISLLAALDNAVIAQSMLQLQQPAEALAHAMVAVDQFPQSADVQAVLAQTLLASGRPAEAQKALDEALRLARADQSGYQRPLIDRIEHSAQHP